MTKHVLVLIGSAFILGCGAIAAGAQQNSNTPMMQQPEQVQRDTPDEDGHGMMEHAMMRQ